MAPALTILLGGLLVSALCLLPAAFHLGRESKTRLLRELNAIERFARLEATSADHERRLQALERRS